MKLKWVSWSSVSEGRSIPGGPITAVPWGNRFALFLADPNGGVFTTGGDPQAGFGPWASVSEGQSTPGGPITAVPWGNRFALFLADPNGGVFTTGGDPQAGFGPWASVSEGQSTPGGPITAVPWGNRVALFLADPNGGVFTTGGDPQGGFGPWASVSEGQSTPGGRITAVPWGNRVALFLADPNGGVFTTGGDPQGGFGPWASVSQGQSIPGGPIAAVPWGNGFALFLADPNGGVFTTAGDPQAGFGRWTSVSEGRSAPGGSVTAVPYRDGLAVFLSDPNGGIYSVVGNPDAGWGLWSSVSDGRSTPGAPVSAVPYSKGLELFVADPNGGVYTTSSVPLLTSVTITFDTHDDDKDDITLVHVFVKNRLNNSLSPEANTDFLSNWLALQRYQPNGDLNNGERNPYLAFKLFLGAGETFDDPSSHTFTLDLVSQDISVNDVVLPVVNIHMLAGGPALGHDRWIFDYTVTLTFDTGEFTFVSAADGVPGVILDQDNRNHSGFGIENPLRTLPLPVLPKPTTNALLRKVTLDFSTHNDNKESETRLNVHIVNRLSATSAQDVAVGLDLFHDQEFPDSGERADVYRKFSWSSDEGTLISNTIRLADMVLPVVNVVIVPNGNDRWIFNYRVTFEFEDSNDFGPKRHVFSSETSGIILDQDNNKHSGVYQGRPFPTVAPPTAPKLTRQPIDHTGEGTRKSISIDFLRRKLDEFITKRNRPDDGVNPPLHKIHLGATPFVSPVSSPLPESYYDLQSLINGGDGHVHYVSAPTSLDQMYKYLGFANAYLGNIDSESVRLDIDVGQAAPFTLTINFKSGGTLWVANFGTITLEKFSIALKLTLDKATVVNQFNVSHTVVDVTSWVTELQNMNVAVEKVVDNVTYYRHTGTFLHQPIDLVNSDPSGDLFLEQVVTVSLSTGSWSDPEGILHDTIRGKIHSALTEQNVITGRTKRDGLNSLVTSWLLGGVADDELNTDENNAEIREVGILNANPELGIAEDQIVLGYLGPKNIFVGQAPANWPTTGHPSAAHDFSPGTLAHIDHIVVLTKENRSFDHMLGYLSLPVERGGMGRRDVDGLTGGEVNLYNGESFPSFELSDTRFVPGPPNDYEPVHHAINGGRMDGFVRSYAEANGDAVAGQVMGYYTGAKVPVFDALARDFAIGHRWFSSHPGPTFPNRFYELTGRPNLDARGFWEFSNSSPMLPVFTPTIFDYLDGALDPISGAPVTWRYFEHAYCTLRFFEHHTFDHRNIVALDDPEEGFLALASTGQLPSVSFIDPHFVDYPPGSNCDEPPSDIADGQEHVQRIVEAVVASPAWNKTLLLIVYDEHGGFYDHVPPPAAARVSDDFPIFTAGVRVPAFVISPWVTAGSVFGYDGDARVSSGIVHGLHFDHTSILKTIARRFLSDNPPYLGARYAAANDLSVVIGSQLRTPQFLPFIRYRIQSTQSRQMLSVKQFEPASRTVICEAQEERPAQYFSFEAAGNGFVHIRSHVHNHYLMAQSPDYVLTVGTKDSPGANWRLSRAGTSTVDRNLYVISNQAYPNMVLQPAAPGESELSVVLGHAGGRLGAYGGDPYAWDISPVGSPMSR